MPHMRDLIHTHITFAVCLYTTFYLDDTIVCYIRAYIYICVEHSLEKRYTLNPQLPFNRCIPSKFKFSLAHERVHLKYNVAHYKCISIWHHV